MEKNYFIQPIQGLEWEVNIHFNMSGEETPPDLDDPNALILQISDLFPNKSQIFEEMPEPHEVLKFLMKT